MATIIFSRAAPWVYRHMQKKFPLFEFPSFLLLYVLGQPMHSQSVLTKFFSANYIPHLLFLDPVQAKPGRRGKQQQEDSG